MGIFDGLMGNASEVNIERLEQEITPLMIEGESMHKAFKLIRDLIVFTNKRIILIDKQGMTGKKTEFFSIPYRSINILVRKVLVILIWMLKLRFGFLEKIHLGNLSLRGMILWMRFIGF